MAAHCSVTIDAQLFWSTNRGLYKAPGQLVDSDNGDRSCFWNFGFLPSTTQLIPCFCYSDSFLWKYQFLYCIGLQTGNTKYIIPNTHWWQTPPRSHQNHVNNRQVSIKWKLQQPWVVLLMGTEHELWIFTDVMPNRTVYSALISN
jgi:hypothetical protein